jgi:hypothetical protein
MGLQGRFQRLSPHGNLARNLESLVRTISMIRIKIVCLFRRWASKDGSRATQDSSSQGVDPTPETPNMHLSSSYKGGLLQIRDMDATTLAGF